ncbi:MAG: nitrile hydratase subunit alpha [Armatimonadetes bacterium]|nr:nitrile hydratase subunit alpha [Armatimonadota bacterium]
MGEQKIFGLTSEELGRASREIIARAWSDPGYAARLQADPRGALKELGWSLPVGARLRFLQDTPRRQHFVLPAKPAEWNDVYLRP